MTHAVFWEGEITFGGRNGNRKDQVTLEVIERESISRNFWNCRAFGG